MGVGVFLVDRDFLGWNDTSKTTIQETEGLPPKGSICYLHTRVIVSKTGDISFGGTRFQSIKQFQRPLRLDLQMPEIDTSLESDPRHPGTFSVEKAEAPRGCLLDYAAESINYGALNEKKLWLM